jgi:hypothetical protein
MLAFFLLAAVLVAALSILFLRLDRATPKAPPTDRRPRIPPPHFRAVVIDLLRRLGLDIVEEELRGPERRLVAVRDGKPEAGRCVIFVESAPPDDLVPRPLLRELRESIRGENGAVGLLVTPYNIEPEPAPALDVPVELVDGRKLRQLVAAYMPERLAELDRYRGFSAAGA